MPTNICFGGDDMRTAWVTLSAMGKLARTTWARPGLTLNF
jgi:gluconolactonase